MGGQGSEGVPTAGIVGLSLREGRREIRGHDPRGDDDGIASGSHWKDLQEKPLGV